MAFGHINWKASNMVRWFKRIAGDVTFSFSAAIKSKVVAIQGTSVTGTTGTGNVVFSSGPSIASPALTGTPTAPTPALTDNSTTICTTNYTTNTVQGSNAYRLLGAF